MSHLEELVQTLCPDGVEYKQLGRVSKILTAPLKLNRSQYQDTGRYPIVDQGQSFIVGFTNNLQATLPENKYILFGDHTRIVKYVDFAFAQGADGLKIIVPLGNKLDPKFLYYAISNLQIPSRGYNRHWSLAQELKIPLPPLPVQQEIVRILDTMTDVVAELEAELSARVRQFEHYRNELLSSESKSRLMEMSLADLNLETEEIVELDQLLDYSQPTSYIVKSTQYDNSFDTPVLTAGASFILGYTNETKGIYEASCDKPVIIFDDFTTSFHWVDFNFKVKSSAMKILTEPKHKPALLRYVFYAMKCITYRPSEHARQWIQTYSKIQIPLPPILIQKKIVSTLDRFDALVNDLKSGLPAEIALRRKQYEYYRDKLLTFKEKPA